MCYLWFQPMLEKIGIVLFAIGGALLFLALYLVLYTVQQQYYNPTQGIIGVLFFSAIGFGLLAYGLYLVIKSATSSEQADA